MKSCHCFQGICSNPNTLFQTLDTSHSHVLLGIAWSPRPARFFSPRHSQELIFKPMEAFQERLGKNIKSSKMYTLAKRKTDTSQKFRWPPHGKPPKKLWNSVESDLEIPTGFWGTGVGQSVQGAFHPPLALGWKTNRKWSDTKGKPHLN